MFQYIYFHQRATVEPIYEYQFYYSTGISGRVARDALDVNWHLFIVRQSQEKLDEPRIQ